MQTLKVSLLLITTATAVALFAAESGAPTSDAKSGGCCPVAAAKVHGDTHASSSTRSQARTSIGSPRGLATFPASSTALASHDSMGHCKGMKESAGAPGCCR